MDILEILGKIGFDWQVALANLVNFLIIYWILKKFAFGPIEKVLVKRQQTIKEGVDNAIAAKTALLTAEQQKEAEIKQARRDAHLILSDAKSNGIALVDEAKGNAIKEAELIITGAKQQAGMEATSALRDFRKKAVDIVVNATENTLVNVMDSTLNNKIVTGASLQLKK